MNFTIDAPKNRTVQLRGFDSTKNVSCQVQANGQLSNLDRSSTPSTSDTLSIFCTRDPSKEPGPQGEAVYEEAAIQFGIADAANYSVLWPKDERVPVSLASQISARLSRLENRRTSLECDSTQEQTPIKRYPTITANIPSDKRGSYQLTGGGCKINSYDTQPRAAHNGPIMESHPTEDRTGWYCHAGDPPNIELALQLTAYVVYCRADAR
jgi:hypothetical protein